MKSGLRKGPLKNRFLSGIRAAGPLRWEGGDVWHMLRLFIISFSSSPSPRRRGPSNQSVLGAPKPECAGAPKPECDGGPQTRVCLGAPDGVNPPLSEGSSTGQGWKFPSLCRSGPTKNATDRLGGPTNRSQWTDMIIPCISGTI